MKKKVLPTPEFFDELHAREWSYAPDQQALFEQSVAWRREHELTPAAQDASRVELLLIDVQKDFCFPEGSLYVGGRGGDGALDDNARLARFIYSNLSGLTDITCTLDTHYPFQIFFPAFWRDRAGAPLGPHREIHAEEIRAGDVVPNPDVTPWVAEGDADWLRKQVEFYCDELERAGKYTLYLWPPHCLLGSAGHGLAGVVHEARIFHAFARSAASRIEVKGGHPLTENYSVLSPEVLRRHDGGPPLAERNLRLGRRLLEADKLVVAGQAASHCVRSSIDDLLDRIREEDPGLAGKVYVLRDCMSSVAVPDPERDGEFLFDFTPQAEAALERYAEAGMHLVDSTLPIHEWPESRG